MSESRILLEKIKEQAHIAEHLISLIPIEALEWRPQILTATCTPASPRDRSCDFSSDSSKMTDSTPSDFSRNQFTKSNDELLPIGYLLGHLLDCMAGFCALLYSANTVELAHLRKLRDLEVNHFCGIQEAQARMHEYMRYIEEGFALLDDVDLSKALPTVFVPEGEPILTLVLGNLEHLINHKYQLFLYLRLLGVPVGTQDLYRFRS
jgi:hypothetical protein